MLDDHQKNKLNDLKLILEVVAKLVALGSVCCMIIGVLIIWLYLINVGVGSEIISAIASPQVLLVMAITSIVISICFVYSFVIFPSIIKSCEGNEYDWSINVDDMTNHWLFKYNIIRRNENKLFYALFTFVALILLIICMEIHVIYNYNILLMFIVPVCLGIAYYKHKGIANGNNVVNVIFKRIAICLTIAVSYAILIYILYFVTQTAYLYISRDNNITIYVLIVFSIMYSLTTSYAIDSNKFNAIIPVAFLGMLVVVPLIINDGASKIVSKLGFGGFSESIILKENQARVFKESDGYKINNIQDDDVKLIDNLWVIIKLPTKLVVSSRKESKHIITIPTTGLLAETSISHKTGDK